MGLVLPLLLTAFVIAVPSDVAAAQYPKPWMVPGHYFEYNVVVTQTLPEYRVDAFNYKVTVLSATATDLFVFENYTAGTETIAFDNTFGIDSRISSVITNVQYGSWLWVNELNTFSTGVARLTDRDYAMSFSQTDYWFRYTDASGNVSDLHFSFTDWILTSGADHVINVYDSTTYVADVQVNLVGQGGGFTGGPPVESGGGTPAVARVTTLERARLAGRTGGGIGTLGPGHPEFFQPPYNTYTPDENHNGWGTTWGDHDATGSAASGTMRNFAFTEAWSGIGARVDWAWGRMLGPQSGSFQVDHNGIYQARFTVRLTGFASYYCMSPSWRGASQSKVLVQEQAYIGVPTEGIQLRVIYNIYCWYGGFGYTPWNNANFDVVITRDAQGNLMDLIAGRNYIFYLEYYSETRAGVIGVGFAYGWADATLTLQSVLVDHTV